MKTLYIQRSSSGKHKDNCLILDAWVLIIKGEVITLLDLAEWRDLDAFSREWSERSLEELNQLKPEQDKYLSHLCLNSAKLFLYQEMINYQLLKTLIARVLEIRGFSELCFLGVENEVFRCVADYFSLAVRFEPAKDTQRSLKERLLHFVKVKHLDWTVRAISCLSFKKSYKPQAVDLIFSFDVHNKAMIATLNAVLLQAANSGFKCLAIYYEKRVENQIVNHENVVKMPLLGFYTVQNILKAVMTFSAQRRLLKDSDIKQRYALKESSCEDLGITNLNGVYAFQMMLDVFAMRTMFDRVQAKTVFLASDSHRSARLLTLVAKEKEVKTVVAQHGAVVGAFAYVPVIADVIGVWGPWCKTWFERHKVPSYKLAVTGSPRAKQIYTLDVASKKHFLLATQPVAMSVTKNLLERVFNVLKNNPNYKLKIRPHPGEPQITFLRSFIEEADTSVQAQVELEYPTSSLEEDLSTAQAVITSQSTFGIDALRFSCPLIILSHPLIDEAIPFDEFDCARYAANSQELELHMTAVQQDDVQEQLKQNATKFLYAYTSAFGETAAQSLLELREQE